MVPAAARRGRSRATQAPCISPAKVDPGVRPGPGLCAYVAPAILGSKFYFISFRNGPAPARLRTWSPGFLQAAL
jgi:hypothetical protein